MPSNYRILPEHFLVVITHEGHVSVDDTLGMMARFAQDPDAQHGQRHLVDMSRVESHDEDHARILSMHARNLDVVGGEGPEMLLVLYAPTPPARSMAALIAAAWEPSPIVIPRIVTEEADALAMLGLRHARIAELLQTPA